MISVTLNFKNLDSARRALLDIPEELLIVEAPSPKPVAASEGAPGQATAKATAAPAKTVKEKTPAAASAEVLSQPSTAATADPKPQGSSGSSPKPSASAASPAAIEYAQIGAAITAFAATNGRDATLAKLAEFGVKSGKELKPEQYADALIAFTGFEVA